MSHASVAQINLTATYREVAVASFSQLSLRYPAIARQLRETKQQKLTPKPVRDGRSYCVQLGVVAARGKIV